MPQMVPKQRYCHLLHADAPRGLAKGQAVERVSQATSWLQKPPSGRLPALLKWPFALQRSVAEAHVPGEVRRGRGRSLA